MKKKSIFNKVEISNMKPDSFLDIQNFDQVNMKKNCIMFLSSPDAIKKLHLNDCDYNNSIKLFEKAFNVINEKKKLDKFGMKNKRLESNNEIFYKNKFKKNSIIREHSKEKEFKIPDLFNLKKKETDTEKIDLIKNNSVMNYKDTSPYEIISFFKEKDKNGIKFTDLKKINEEKINKVANLKERTKLEKIFTNFASQNDSVSKILHVSPLKIETEIYNNDKKEILADTFCLKQNENLENEKNKIAGFKCKPKSEIITHKFNYKKSIHSEMFNNKNKKVNGSSGSSNVKINKVNSQFFCTETMIDKKLKNIKFNFQLIPAKKLNENYLTSINNDSLYRGGEDDITPSQNLVTYESPLLNDSKQINSSRLNNSYDNSNLLKTQKYKDFELKQEQIANLKNDIKNISEPNFNKVKSLLKTKEHFMRNSNLLKKSKFSNNNKNRTSNYDNIKSKFKKEITPYCEQTFQNILKKSKFQMANYLKDKKSKKENIFAKTSSKIFNFTQNGHSVAKNILRESIINQNKMENVIQEFRNKLPKDWNYYADKNMGKESIEEHKIKGVFIYDKTSGGYHLSNYKRIFGMDKSISALIKKKD